MHVCAHACRCHGSTSATIPPELPTLWVGWLVWDEAHYASLAGLIFMEICPSLPLKFWSKGTCHHAWLYSPVFSDSELAIDAKLANHWATGPFLPHLLRAGIIAARHRPGCLHVSSGYHTWFFVFVQQALDPVRSHPPPMFRHSQEGMGPCWSPWEMSCLAS